MLKGFFALMSTLFLWVDGGEGGGAVDEDDFLIDDPEPTPATPEPKDEPKDEPAKKVDDKPPAKAELDDETKKKIEELEADKEARDIESAISAAVDELKDEYPDFDIEKVSTFLQDLHKTNPTKAESYNTPAGWESVWLKNFATREEDGTFDPGRNNADEPYDFKKTRKEALSGDKKAMKKLFENAK